MFDRLFKSKSCEDSIKETEKLPKPEIPEFDDEQYNTLHEYYFWFIEYYKKQKNAWFEHCRIVRKHDKEKVMKLLMKEFPYESEYTHVERKMMKDIDVWRWEEPGEKVTKEKRIVVNIDVSHYYDRWSCTRSRFPYVKIYHSDRFRDNIRNIEWYEDIYTRKEIDLQ